MSFTPIDVKDRNVQYPNRYRLTNVGTDVYDITTEPGLITEAGTDINKAFLQPMQDGIDQNQTDIGNNATAIGQNENDIQVNFDSIKNYEASGTASAVSVTTDNTKFQYTSIFDGLPISIIITSAGNISTVNINGLGALVAQDKNGDPLSVEVSDVVTAIFRYNGGAPFFLLAPKGGLIIDAEKAEYEIDTGSSFVKGDTAELIDNKARTPVEYLRQGQPFKFYDRNIRDLKAYALNEDLTMLLYFNNNDARIEMSVHKLSGDKFSYFGRYIGIDTGISFTDYDACVVSRSGSTFKIMIAWANNVQIYEIFDTGASIGVTAYTVYSIDSGTVFEPKLALVDTDKVLVVYPGIKAKVLIVNGYVIDNTSPVYTMSNNGSSIQVKTVDTNKALIGYVDQVAGVTGYAVIATISGTIVTFHESDKHQFESDAMRKLILSNSLQNNIFCVYTLQNDYCYGKSFEVTGTTISSSTVRLTLDEAVTTIIGAAKLQDGNVFVLYGNQVAKIYIDGLNMSKTGQKIFDENISSLYATCVAMYRDRVPIFYSGTTAGDDYVRINKYLKNAHLIARQSGNAGETIKFYDFNNDFSLSNN